MLGARNQESNKDKLGIELKILQLKEQDIREIKKLRVH